MAEASRGAQSSARGYRSVLRRERAEQTSSRICQAAAPLFAARGYSRTSVRQIAAAAGVAVETIYAMGGKADLFLRAFEWALSGTEHGAALLELQEVRAARTADTLSEFVGVVTDFLVVSNGRSVRLWRAFVEAANTDPHLLQAYTARMTQMRLDGRQVLAYAVEHQLCPQPADPVRTVDAIWATLHPSQYDLLVEQAHWSQEQYRNWLNTTTLTLLSSDAALQ